MSNFSTLLGLLRLFVNGNALAVVHGVIVTVRVVLALLAFAAWLLMHLPLLHFFDDARDG
jgi:hypothetical protein